MQNRLWVVVPAAGRGERFGGSLPKQYAKLGGRTVIEHTLGCFAGVPRIVGMVVPLAADDKTFGKLTLPDVPVHTTVGGATRAQSVLAALEWLQNGPAADKDWVLVHDAARPLLSRADLDALITECEQNDIGGLLGVPVADTLKRSSGGQVHGTMKRDDVWHAMTPQMFKLGPLERALRAAGPDATDEAMAMEMTGVAPAMVRGSTDNLKITTVGDLLVADAILAAR